MARWAAIRSRMDFGAVAPPLASSSGGTFAGGGGGATPRTLSMIHLPRFTGEVRIACDVVVSTLACPSRP